MPTKVAGESRTTAKTGRLPLAASPSGQSLSEYSPTLGDKLAWKLSDWFKVDPDYTREKLVPFTPVANVEHATRQALGKVKAGDYGGAALDVALEMPFGKLGKAGGAVLGGVMGPLAKDWNRDMAKKAVDMAKKGAGWDEIQALTNTAFRKIGEGRFKPGKNVPSPGLLTPVQMISSRDMKISPDILTQLKPGVRDPVTGKPVGPAIKEFISGHPAFEQYPGLGDKPVWLGTNSSLGTHYYDKRLPPGVDKTLGFSFKPSALNLKQASDLPADVPMAPDLGQHTMSWPEIVEHEIHHSVGAVEDWPGPDVPNWSSWPIDPSAMKPRSPERYLWDQMRGDYGKARYPVFGTSPMDRFQYGFYQSDTDEAFVRNAARQVGLSPEGMLKNPFVTTYDMPFNLQQVSKDVYLRNQKALQGLNP